MGNVVHNISDDHIVQQRYHQQVHRAFHATRVFEVVRSGLVVPSGIASHAEKLLGAACERVPHDLLGTHCYPIILTARDLREADQSLLAIQKECGEDGLALEDEPDTQETQEQVRISQDLRASPAAISEQGIRAIDDSRCISRLQHFALTGFVTSVERLRDFAGARA